MTSINKLYTEKADIFDLSISFYHLVIRVDRSGDLNKRQNSKKNLLRQKYKFNLTLNLQLQNILVALISENFGFCKKNRIFLWTECHNYMTVIRFLSTKFFVKFKIFSQHHMLHFLSHSC